jgi:aquaporin Z
MKKSFVEFIGTFFLVFTIGSVVLPPGAGAFAPLAIGAVLMVMIFAGGHVSGAHYNPAITLAVWIRGRCPTSDVVPYMIAQVLAAVVAAFALRYLHPHGATGPFAIGFKAALVAEFLFTFALAWVILNVATAKGTAGNSFYGLAIGMTVMAGAFAVGGISGGAFNPAVAVGIILMGLQSWSNLWIYLVADFAGAAVAAVAYRYVNGRD